MRLYVEKYERFFNRHICTDPKGRTIRVDLMVNGDFHKFTKDLDKEEYHEFCELMVGKTFEVEDLYPNEHIGMGVTEVPVPFKAGQKVHYEPDHYRRENIFENGIIKRVDSTCEVAWVVYNCDGNWDRIEDYTAACTDFKDLKPGWKEE